MSKLQQSYLRVIWQGEVYYVIGSGEIPVFTDDQLGEVIILPTLLVAKVEQARSKTGKEKILEVLQHETTPLVSEIKPWLYLHTTF